jgi:O-antigen ligase
MNFTKNVGNTDRIIRFILVVLIAILYFAHVISGTLAVILGILAVIFLVTALINFCPLYTVFKINTRKE